MTIVDIEFINRLIIFNTGGNDFGIKDINKMKEILDSNKCNNLKEINDLAFDLLENDLFKEGSNRTVYIIIYLLLKKFGIDYDIDLEMYITKIVKKLISRYEGLLIIENKDIQQGVG